MLRKTILGSRRATEQCLQALFSPVLPLLGGVGWCFCCSCEGEDLPAASDNETNDGHDSDDDGAGADDDDADSLPNGGPETTAERRNEGKTISKRRRSLPPPTAESMGKSCQFSCARFSWGGGGGIALDAPHGCPGCRYRTCWVVDCFE